MKCQKTSIFHSIHNVTSNVIIFLPDSIFVKIDLAHLRKVSSTFSPVRALVSKNMSSARKRCQ